MTWIDTLQYTQDTGRRQLKQKKNHNTEISKDQQQKNAGHHYTQT